MIDWSKIHLSTRSATRFLITALAAPTLCCAASAQAPPQTLPAARAGNRVIAGVVVSGASGQPIEGADVTLRESSTVNPIAEATTDAQGRFLFANLPDGRFLLSATHRGYVPWSYQEHGGITTAIVTGENFDNTGIVFRLPPLASIYGAVTEDSGDPVPNAQLLLFRQSPLDPDEKSSAGVMGADETGRFEFSQLAPGVYYLCASGSPWYRPRMRQAVAGADQTPSPLDVAYPVNCFSDVDPAGAEPITVGPGDRLETNLMLHPVSAVRITVQMPRPEPGKGFAMPTLQQSIFGFPQATVGPYVEQRAQSSGAPQDQTQDETMTVVLSGVAPGQYEMQLVSGGEETARHGSIDLTSSQVSIDASNLAPFAAITGKVMVAGAGRLSTPSLSLVNSSGVTTGYAQIEADNSFRLVGIPPGTYQLNLRGATGLSVTQLAINGKPADGFNIVVGTAPLDLTVMAAVSNASVDGLVQRNGKRASGVFVLLAPDDPRASFAAWLPNQSDSDGSFVFQHVLPGAYHVVAIEQGWTLDWRRREVIAPYLVRGAAVTVSANSRRVELTGPLEVQLQGGAQPLAGSAAK